MNKYQKYNETLTKFWDFITTSDIVNFSADTKTAVSSMFVDSADIDFIYNSTNKTITANLKKTIPTGNAGYGVIFGAGGSLEETRAIYKPNEDTLQLEANNLKFRANLDNNKPLILIDDTLRTTDFPNLQIQTDWSQTNTSAIDYIKNKPSGKLIQTVKRVLTRAEILGLNTTPITLLPTLTGNKVYKILSITAKKTTTSDAGYNGEIQLGYDTQYGGYAINLDRITSTTSGVFELNPDDNRFYGITGEIFPNMSLGFTMLNPISEKGTNTSGFDIYVDYYILDL